MPANGTVEAVHTKLLEAAKVLVKQSGLLSLLLIQRDTLQRQIDEAKKIRNGAHTILVQDSLLRPEESKALQVGDQVVVVRRQSVPNGVTVEIVPVVSSGEV